MARQFARTSARLTVLVPSTRPSMVDRPRLVGADDRLVAARPRRHARAMEAHRLLGRPARGLDDAALDLVDDAVGIHDLAGIRRGHGPRDPHAATAAIDGDVGDERAVAGEI